MTSPKSPRRGERGCGIVQVFGALLVALVVVSIFRLSAETGGMRDEATLLRGHVGELRGAVAELKTLAAAAGSRIAEETTTRREATEGLVKAVKTVDERSRTVAERIAAVDETAYKLSREAKERQFAFDELKQQRMVKSGEGGALEARVRSLEVAAHTAFAQEVSRLDKRLRGLEKRANVTAEPIPAHFAAKKAPRHLVMAMAAGYRMREFRHFVDSMRLGAQYRGHCALFVLQDTPALKDPGFGGWREAREFEVVYVDEGPGWKAEAGGKYYTDATWGPGVPAAVARYRQYAWFLATRDPYDLVLWSDFRDAVWQRYPFDDYKMDSKGKDLVFFGEHPVRPLDKDGFTRGWVNACWGLDAIKKHVPAGSNTPCLCSGQAMGTGPALLGYLKQYLAAVDEQYKATKNEACVQTYGIDQGHHNYMVYTQLDKASFTITPWDAGPVATIGFLKHVIGDLRRDEGGFVLRKDGKRMALVHQYDRIDDLVRWVPRYVANLAKTKE